MRVTANCTWLEWVLPPAFAFGWYHGAWYFDVYIGPLGLMFDGDAGVRDFQWRVIRRVY